MVVIPDGCRVEFDDDGGNGSCFVVCRFPIKLFKQESGWVEKKGMRGEQ